MRCAVCQNVSPGYTIFSFARDHFNTYLDEVPILLALVEQRRGLANIGIDPHTDLETTLLQALEVSHSIREHIGVEIKVTPVIGFHPETVKVKHSERNVTITETVKEPSDSILIVVCCKAFQVVSLSETTHQHQDSLVVSQRL